MQDDCSSWDDWTLETKSRRRQCSKELQSVSLKNLIISQSYHCFWNCRIMMKRVQFHWIREKGKSTQHWHISKNRLVIRCRPSDTRIEKSFDEWRRGTQTRSPDLPRCVWRTCLCFVQTCHSLQTLWHEERRVPRRNVEELQREGRYSRGRIVEAIVFKSKLLLGVFEVFSDQLILET